MLHVIAAFFALIFSFGHAGTAHQASAKLQPEPVATYMTYVPTHHEIVSGSFESSYAGTPCASCDRMNVSYSVR